MNIGIIAVALVITAAPPPAAPPSPPPDPPATSSRVISNDSGRLRRCIAADGTSIFTDRRCQDLHAQEDDIRSGSAPRRGASLLRVRSCARNQDDLLFGVRSALEAHDVNRFADYYHWTGMSSAEGYRLLQRLSVFSERPLVDVQLTSSRRPDPYALDDYFLMPEDSLEDPEFGRPEPPPPAAPDLLRVDQMRSDKDLSSQVTYFRLLTNAGCWWLRF